MPFVGFDFMPGVTTADRNVCQMSAQSDVCCRLVPRRRLRRQRLDDPAPARNRKFHGAHPAGDVSATRPPPFLWCGQDEALCEFPPRRPQNFPQVELYIVRIPDYLYNDADKTKTILYLMNTQGYDCVLSATQLITSRLPYMQFLTGGVQPYSARWERERERGICCVRRAPGFVCGMGTF